MRFRKRALLPEGLFGLSIPYQPARRTISGPVPPGLLLTTASGSDRSMCPMADPNALKDELITVAPGSHFDTDSQYPKLPLTGPQPVRRGNGQQAGRWWSVQTSLSRKTAILAVEPRKRATTK